MSNYTVLKNDSAAVNLRIAVFLAEASQAAYDSEVKLADWAARAELPNLHAFDHRNVQGFWCVHDEIALLAFRGTSNIGQWLRDARFFPAAYPWGLLHRGFRDGVYAQAGALENFLRTAADAKAPYIWITGHSLGGALAVIAASKLKIMQPSSVSAKVYTYGQPRVGLESFASRFDQELPTRLVRFVNQADIVARVPPDPFFHHTGWVKRIVKPGLLEMAVAESSVELSPEQVERLEALRRATRLPAESGPVAESAAVETTLAESDLPSLTPEQFAELQFGLGATPAEKFGAGPAESVPEGVISLPAFDDHAIAEYIRLLKELEAKA